MIRVVIGGELFTEGCLIEAGNSIRIAKEDVATTLKFPKGSIEITHKSPSKIGPLVEWWMALFGNKKMVKSHQRMLFRRCLSARMMACGLRGTLLFCCLSFWLLVRIMDMPTTSSCITLGTLIILGSLIGVVLFLTQW